MKTGIILILFLFTLAFFTCSNDPIIPPDDDLPDTTSQNFTFETFEFGDGFESSYFNDVWIFDENNIWAVGYISDSLFGKKNIMHWNGFAWNPLGIQFNSAGIDGIWALDSSNIYFAAGYIIKYENGKFIETDLGHLGFTNGQRIEKLWGSSENNIWGVGPFGTIVHYDGNIWKKIEFDRQWYFSGLTGNRNSGKSYAIAINSNFTCIIIELSISDARIIYNSDTTRLKLIAYGILFLDNELILSGNDIWKYNLLNTKEEIIFDTPIGYYLPRLSASAVNDIYFFGNQYQMGEKMIHYNGNRYSEFNLPEREFIIYGGCFSIKDLSVLGSYSNNRAYLIKIMRR